ncbi:hypothetical protein PENSPDRAFT_346549 [Peniophora sp. CONT]|nr:hypothetical protein PENSPDRAFT_346549 [Peniophora sp. CONT]
MLGAAEIRVVLTAAGLEVEGWINTRFIERIVQEGYVAADMEAMYEIQTAECSDNGTGHRHMENISCHINITSISPTLPSQHHFSVLKRSHPTRTTQSRDSRGKSADIQVVVFQNVLTAEYPDIYEPAAAPLSQKLPIPLYVILAKFKAWLTDHAKNDNPVGIYGRTLIQVDTTLEAMLNMPRAPGLFVVCR